MAVTGVISSIKLPNTEEYNLKDNDAARASHTHGNLTNDGKITSTATITSGDKLVIVDSDSTAGSKITGSSITFGTSTTLWLNNSGTWSTPKTSELTNDSQFISGIPYAAVDSTSTSTAYTATVSGITELKDGTTVMLRNGVITSAAGFTININGLGAYPVYSSMSAATAETTIFNANYTMLFVFDTTRVSGGCWVLYRGYDSNTNTIGYQLRTNSTVLKTADRTRYYRMLFTSADGTHWVPANTQYDNSWSSLKTVNQRPIDPFGRIVYLSNTTNYNAEADVPSTAVWDQYSISFGHSFNNSGLTLSLTVNAPVYIKCAPYASGGAIIDSTTPYVLALPSTADGKIYIFLGIAYSETLVELVQGHPVYYHDGSGIRLWTGKIINFDGELMFYSTSGNTSIYSRDCDLLIANGHYWFDSNGPDASLGTEAPDGTGSLYVLNYSNIWVSLIAQDYRTGHLFVRSRNNGTWTAWKKVYDSDNKPTLAELNLPAVSASDNGKFMMVVNGAWAAVTVPASEGVNF